MKPAFKNSTRSKFKAVRVVVDGQKFDSKAEARRYGELKALEKAGEIWDVERQVSYPLEVNGVLVATYVADFRYVDATARELVVEDVKGYMRRKSKAKKPRGDGTVLSSAPHVQVFEIKRKLVKALYGIEVKIVS